MIFITFRYLSFNMIASENELNCFLVTLYPLQGWSVGGKKKKRKKEKKTTYHFLHIIKFKPFAINKVHQILSSIWAKR